MPWAALTDADGRYLIERHVIRTAPSLRVARQAADKMQTSGHIVLVGNPLPTRLSSVRYAEKEVEDIYKILNRVGLDVLPEHHFREDLNPPATKANVKNSLEGAAWAHMAVHATADSLVLAMPRGSADPHKDSALSMLEVHGSEQEKGVKMALGATAVGMVVGPARDFLLANASASVVSLWTPHDRSTAALMRIKYTHLAEGLTVPQALRLAMLRLARRRHAPLAVPARHKKARDSEACESRQAARDSGRYLELGDFKRQDGDGAWGNSVGGSGGVLPALQPWIEMLGVATEGTSRCAASSSAAAHAATHMHLCETEEERRQYWREFCKRDVAPTCVLDLAYADHGGLELSPDNPDDRLLERLYCFEDREDDAHQLPGGRRRRVILKVHTLRKWRERGDKLYERVSKVTAVKFMYAYWNTHSQMFEMEGQSELKLLPVSEQLQDTWRDTYRRKRYGEIEWEWRKAGSMPSADADTGTGEVKRVYDEVRAVIKLGEGMFPRGATATDKSMQGYHSPWKETHGVFQVLPLSLSLSLSLSLILPLPPSLPLPPLSLAQYCPTIPCRHQVLLGLERL